MTDTRTVPVAGGLAASLLALTLFSAPAHALVLSNTDFEDFTTGVSVNGQGGWSATGGFLDEEVVDDGTGNTAWRVSNSGANGSFADQPYTPRPGGIPNVPTDPVNSMPNSFAGEASTGANFRRFYAEFGFKPAANADTNDGARVTVSADDGAGGRHGFFALEDNGTNGLSVTAFDYDGGFVGPTLIASSLSRDEYHTIAIEIVFADGADNDVINIYLDDALIDTQNSWEEYYKDDAGQFALHPLGVASQALLFRVSGPEVPEVDGAGFYIDNVLTLISEPVPAPGMLSLFGLAIAGLGAAARRRR